VLFLVGDAPPHDQFAARTLAAVEQLRQQGVRIYPVAGSGVKERAEFVLRSAAFLTLGQYLFLTDHSGVGRPHAAPHVPSYAVEHLNRLMLRMIASELAGKPLAAAEVLAIERGDLDPAEIEPEQIQQQAGVVIPARPIQRSGLTVFLAGIWHTKPPAWAILLVVLIVVGTADAVIGRFRRRSDSADFSSAGSKGSVPNS
jgi:hypothetical protein